MSAAAVTLASTAPPLHAGASLSKLLTFLGGAQGGGADAYRKMRARLESFFRWKGLRDSLALTDETLDRVARRVAAEEVRTESPAAFVLGVARLVAMEASRKDRVEVPLDTPVAAPEPDVDEDQERALGALERCLEGLVTAERELLLTYYRDDGGARITTRAALAESLGTTPNALRIRAFRLRARVEACVEGRLAEGVK